MIQDNLMEVPSQITVLMERLVQVMRAKGLLMPSYLKPGLTRQEILRLTAGAIELPEDVIAFYAFMNGVRDSPDEYYANTIMFGDRILSLEEALTERNRFLDELDEDEVTSEWVEETGEDVDGWLPILTHDYGYDFIDVNRHARSEPCIFFTDRESLPELSYTNFESMLRTIIACYEHDAYLIEDGVDRDADIDKINAITQLYNHGIQVYDSTEVKADALKQWQELRYSDPEFTSATFERKDAPDNHEREALEDTLNQIHQGDREGALLVIEGLKVKFPDSAIGMIHIQEAGEQEAVESAKNLYYQGDWPGAIAAFRQLLVRFPNSIIVDGELDYVKRRYREILQEIDERQQALSRNPQNGEARYQLGYLLRITGKTHQAREEWTKIVIEDTGHWAKSAKKMLLDKYPDLNAT